MDLRSTLRMPNALALRARNAAGSADVDLLTLDASDRLVLRGTAGDGLVIDSAGLVGVGISQPITALHVAWDDNTVGGVNPRGILMDAVDSVGHSAHITIRKARGTRGSETTLLASDYVGAITTEAFDGTAYRRSGYLAWIVQETTGVNTKSEWCLRQTGASETALITIFTGGLVGINVGSGQTVTSATALLDIQGTPSPATIARVIQVGATLASSQTGNQYGFDLRPVFTPAGGSLTAIYGNAAIPSLNGSSLTVTDFVGYYGRPDLGASFAGTVTNAIRFEGANSTVAAGALTNQFGARIAALTAGTNNCGIAVGEATGTANSNLVLGQVTIPSGSWSLYSASADNSHFAGAVLIGTTTQAARLDVGGTFTTAFSAAIKLSTTLASSATSNQYGFECRPSFNPSGASLTNVYAVLNIPVISGSALNITDVVGLFARPDTGASYSGTITNAIRLEAANSTVAGGTITNQFGARIAALTVGTNNCGIAIGEATGTANANLVLGQVTIPAGSWSLYSASTDPSLFTGKLAVGGSAAPTARLEVSEATLGNEVMRVTSVATNDDPTESVFQQRVTTTDATVTTLVAITIPSSTTVRVEAQIVARRTGGSAGTAEDGAAYHLSAAFKGASGTAAQIGTTTVIASHESQAGWDCVFDVSTSTARIRVTGAANNNVTWHVTYRTYAVGT